MATKVEPDEGRRWTAAALGAAILLAFGLTASLIRTVNVNWDEFHYLAYVYDQARGELDYRWATFHVHLFGWLRSMAGDEVEQVIAARTALFFVAAASGALLYRIARRFVDRDPALVAVLAYASFGYLMRHGVSFRPDPICAFLFLLAIDCLLRPVGKVSALTCGAALALSVLVSLKSAVLVGVAGLVALALLFYSPASRRALTGRLAVAALAFFGIWGALFAWHGTQVTSRAVAERGSFLWGAVTKVFGEGSLFPQARAVRESLRNDSMTWILIALGILIALVGWLRRRELGGGREAILLLFASPLLGLVFYRNSFPYAYVVMVPLALVPAAWAFDWLRRRLGAARPRLAVALAAVVALAMVSSALAFHARHRFDQTAPQRQLMAVVHRLFPEPVAYIDRCSMVSSFPKVGFFMSSWGIQRYRELRRPIFREILESRPVPFLIANGYSLAISLPDAAVAGKPFSLLREDLALLRENYLPHWGILYVQGKSFDFRETPGAREFEILAGGRFTVESDGSVEIDGFAAAHGDVRELETGWHRIAPSSGATFARLRWGDRLPVPNFAPLPAPIFTDF